MKDPRHISGLAVFILLMLAAVLANVASYFLLSDRYGVQWGWQDLVVRVGFPFLMFERGGFNGRDNFYVGAAAKNLTIALAIAVVGALVFSVIRRNERE